MKRTDGDISETITVFLSVFACMSGLNNMYSGHGKTGVEEIFYISVLFSFNYWLCFYSQKQTQQ